MQMPKRRNRSVCVCVEVVQGYVCVWPFCSRLDDCLLTCLLAYFLCIAFFSHSFFSFFCLIVFCLFFQCWALTHSFPFGYVTLRAFRHARCLISCLFVCLFIALSLSPVRLCLQFYRIECTTNKNAKCVMFPFMIGTSFQKKSLGSSATNYNLFCFF